MTREGRHSGSGGDGRGGTLEERGRTAFPAGSWYRLRVLARTTAGFSTGLFDSGSYGYGPWLAEAWRSWLLPWHRHPDLGGRGRDAAEGEGGREGGSPRVQTALPAHVFFFLLVPSYPWFPAGRNISLELLDERLLRGGL
jgi:hypothetical protein